MVRIHTLKQKILSSVVLSALVVPMAMNSGVHAACNPSDEASSCSADTNFQVNIPEVLTISITHPNEWAAGDVGVFLRNTVNLEVTSNNAAGFTATMTSDSTTTDGAALTNTYSSSDTTIPMLSAAWTRANTTATKFWGYSIDDSSETGTYNAVALRGATTPTSILTTNASGSANQNIYFGAKADNTVDSGTYVGTVIISVVSGTITEDNPVTPVDPATPEDVNPPKTNPTYDNTNDRDRTVYTNTEVATGTTTDTLQVSEGDTTDSYADPHGVTESKINEGTPLATGLAATAAVSAIAGIAFFVAARRREEQDDDEY